MEERMPLAPLHIPSVSAQFVEPKLWPRLPRVAVFNFVNDRKKQADTFMQKKHVIQKNVMLPKKGVQ